MIARRGVLGILAGAAAAFLSGCRLFGGNSYRFKMTVEVETPEGLKTGSNIYEVMAFKQTDLMSGSTGSDTTFNGEAVAVDVVPGKALFALIRLANATGGNADLVQMSMRAMDPAFKYNRLESAQRIASGDGTESPAEVRPEDYPLLVTFADINDPTSVQRVDPADLASSFGAGVRLKRIVVEVTDEDVTVGIEKQLGWLPKHRNISFAGHRYSIDNSLADNLFMGNFSTEIKK